MQRFRNNLLALGLLVLAALAIGGLRARLNRQFGATEEKNDVLALPPPSQVVTMSLGYRAAVADLIFAHVLVSSGIHFQEKRLFEFVGNYLETVNALDPKFRAPYRIADTLLTLQVKPVGPEAYREARRILERGLAEFPYDQALWSSAGQFFAYLGPPAFESDPNEQAEWKLKGARTLARACELIGNNENIPYQCITAARLLDNAGAATDSRKFLERMRQVSDDPEIHRFIDAQLKRLGAAQDEGRLQAHREAFTHAWGADLPFITRGALLVVGPNWDPAACAGSELKCATSWRAWSEAREGVLNATGQ
jgi:hypothetical protein